MQNIYNYIVVGGGSAGAVVAARLSEDPDIRVLLLEAGGHGRNPLFRVPMGYALLLSDPRYDWMYQGEPEPGLGGRRLMQHRGKVLGGTSAVNGLVYTRGVPSDYDAWRELGCTGWDWDGVLPYFRKAEDNERGADAFHGTGGPLAVTDQRPSWPLVDAFVDAAAEAGFARNPDLNGVSQEGFGYHQYTIRRRERSSTARAYLAPASKRPNLRIVTGAQATRIRFADRTAVGVEYRTERGLENADCAGEVIVSAGAIASPQLLQLSGIGPGALLSGHGLPVVHESPLVGANLQDHFQSSVDFRSHGASTLNELAISRPRQALAAIRYAAFRRGPLSGNGIYAGGYVRTRPDLPAPDVAINFFLWSRDLQNPSGSALASHPFPGFSLSLVLQRPEARGSVQIVSPDAVDPPAIRYGFPGAGSDVDALVEGIGIARRIAAQPSLARYTVGEMNPGSDIQDTDALRADVLSRVESAYHVVGTCQMGLPGHSVVDARLRVHGVDRLRVVDASIMPQIPAANINAPAIMIGEKGASMIREDRRG